MKMKETWKPVTISGVSGILLGAGGVLGTQKLTAATEEELVAETSDQIKETVMDDSLSFKNAFDGAREQLGPDGLFQWRGNIYSTCTADEWNAKTAEEKDLVAQQVQEMAKNMETETNDLAENVQVTEDDQEVNDDVQISENFSSEDVAVAAVVPDDEPQVAVVANNEPQVTPEDDDNDVRIIGYGDVDLANGNSVTVEELMINGQRVAIIDVDQDGVGDIAMSDINHNNQADEGEIIDLHTGDALSFSDNASIEDTDLPVDFMPL